ncbi:MAG: hypothetical protein ABJN62_04915 [Halioglobus sp.]
MSKKPLHKALGWVLLLFITMGASFLGAQDETATQHIEAPGATADNPAFVQEAISSDDYERAIADLESAQGAYASQLPEYLLSLGLSLQKSGNHQAAISAFKRGVHLARINDGLYSAQQIPLLQREMASHMALGQYAEADERQLYLYRVQMRSMESGITRAQAFIQQAQWQHNAFSLALDGQGYARLMSMWDLYRLALNDIVDRQGATSQLLKEPLEGMLLSQYLIASYDVQGINGAGDNFSMQNQLNRFNAYRAQSYQKGQAVIRAIYDVEAANHGINSQGTIEAKVMLGDWVFWFGKREPAINAYAEAIAELVARGDAESDIALLFDTPVELPNFDGARHLPQVAENERANLLLTFGVDERGKVYNLERVDDNDLNESKAIRLMRNLRRTQFRPRLAMGEPQNTETVTRAYEIKQ